MNVFSLLIFSALQLLSIVALPTDVAPVLSFARYYRDQAVLQRESIVTIWGYTSHQDVPISFSVNGKVLGNATIDPKNKDATCGNLQKWTFELDTRSPNLLASMPFTLSIESGRTTVFSKNIVIGEVIICDGQSNMHWPIYASKVETISSRIRSFKFPATNNTHDTCFNSMTGEAKTLTWMTYDTSVFSNVCYHAALEIQKKTNGYVGTYVPAYPGATAAQLAPPNGEWYKQNHIHLKGISARGVAYYQGESNANRWHVKYFEEDVKKVFAGYRSSINSVNNATLPIVVVQIPIFNQTSMGPPEEQFIIQVQELQLKITKDVPWTYLVKASLHTTTKDLHPKEGKDLIGRDIGLAFSNFISTGSLSVPINSSVTSATSSVISSTLSSTTTRLVSSTAASTKISPTTTLAVTSSMASTSTTSSGSTPRPTVISVAPEISFAEFFKDNAVLQRSAVVKIWGHTSHPELPVKILINDQLVGTVLGSHSDSLCNGRKKWVFEIDTNSLSYLKYDPFTLTISSGASTIHSRNVVLGDVIICDGQGNMDAQIQQTVELNTTPSDSMIRQLRFPSRYITSTATERRCLADMVDENGIKLLWNPSLPASVKKFSAVCYNAALEMKSRSEAPVGMIVVATSVSAIAQFLAPGGQAYNQNFIHLKDVTARGVAFYHGESDSNMFGVRKYEERLRQVITQYRTDVKSAGNKELPFAIVQVPVFDIRPPFGPIDPLKIAELQQIQLKVHGNTNETFLVNSTLYTKTKDLAPKEGKKEIGRDIGLFFFNRI